MRKSMLLGLFLLLMGQFVNAQSILGKWKTIDDETGKEKSIIEIYKKGNKYYGKIVKLLIKPENNNCVKCTGDRKNKPIVGLEIVRDMVVDGDEYDDGTILDPKKGKIYSCKMWIDSDEPDVLNVRGYVAMFFRTQKWKRVK